MSTNEQVADAFHNAVASSVYEAACGTICQLECHVAVSETKIEKVRIVFLPPIESQQRGETVVLTPIIIDDPWINASPLDDTAITKMDAMSRKIGEDIEKRILKGKPGTI